LTGWMITASILLVGF